MRYLHFIQSRFSLTDSYSFFWKSKPFRLLIIRLTSLTVILSCVDVGLLGLAGYLLGKVFMLSGVSGSFVTIQSTVILLIATAFTRLFLMRAVNKIVLDNSLEYKKITSEVMFKRIMRSKRLKCMESGERFLMVDVITLLMPGLLNPLIVFLGEAIIIGLVIAFMALFAPMLLLISSIYALVMAVPLVFIYRTVKQAGAQRTNAESERYEFIDKALRSSEEIRRFSLYDYMDYSYHETTKRLKNAELPFFSNQFVIRPLIEVCTLIYIMMILLLIAYKGDSLLTSLPTGSFIAIAARIFPSIGRLSTSLNSLQYAKSSLKRTKEMESYRDNITCERKYLLSEKKNPESEIILANNIVIRYPSFKLDHGDTLRLVGNSGSGKSTFFGLLLSLNPPNSIKSISPSDSILSPLKQVEYANIAYAKQNSTPIFDSLHDEYTILYGRNILGEDRFRMLFRLCHMEEFVSINQLKDARFSELSGGQRQRSILLRELLNFPKLIILDEALSGLPAEKQDEIMAGIKSYLKGSALLFVCHSTHKFSFPYKTITIV